MSNSVYICASSLCCALVVCSVVRIVTPSGSTQRIMNLVICMFSVCCLISPLYSLVSSIKTVKNEMVTNDIETQKIVGIYDTEVMKLSSEYINEYVNSLLESADVINPRIETILSSDDNGGIYISEMNIYLSESQKNNLNDIKELIYSAVGVVPNITES